MADVIMDFNGVRKRVPAERVAYFQEKKGGKVVEDKPTPAAAPNPSMLERAREGVKGLARGAADAVRGVSETQQDMGQSFLKGASLGLDDEVAKLAARAGATVQRQRDSDDQALSGGGESLLESWRASKDLGNEARDERRQETAAASERSPIASGVGTLAGAAATGMAAPGAQGRRLTQIASGAATGAIGGAGMGDADNAEDMAADAALGGALGGGLTAAAGPVVGLVKRAAGAVRTAAAPKPTSAPGQTRSQVADLLTEVADKGATESVRKRVVGKAAEMVRGAPAQPASTRSAYEQALDEAMSRMDDPAVLTRANQAIAQGPAEPILLTTPKPRATASLVPAIDEAEAVGPAEVRRAIGEISERAAPPKPGRGAGGEVLTDLRKATLGRTPTQAEIRDAIEAVAIREGTTDIATLQNLTGVPTTRLREVLVPMLRNAQFRAAVSAAKPPAGAVSSAADEAADMGRTVRQAKEGAQSPIDNVSGRPGRQVAAVQQQEKWRAAFDALPPEQRSLFIDQLRRETGLADDVIRRRLKMTLSEWRRTSMSRAPRRSVGEKGTTPTGDTLAPPPG